MTFNINEIKSTINQNGGIARNSQYSVYINTPPCFSNNWPNYLHIVCDTASLPGRQILSTPQVIYGAERKMPYGVVYSDFNVSFICTNNMFERKAIDAWHSAIQDPTNNYMKYYDDYVTTITVVKFNGQGQQTYKVEILEAYPSTIEEQSLSWETEQLLKLNVQFTYLKWRNQSDIQASNKAGSGFNSDDSPSLPDPEVDRSEGVLEELKKFKIQF